MTNIYNLVGRIVQDIFRIFGIGIGLPLFWLGIFIFLVSAGYGFSMIVLGGRGQNQKLDLFQNAWLGLGVLVAFIQLWSLFEPINTTLLLVSVLLVLAAASIAIMATYKRSTDKHVIHKVEWPRTLIWCLLVVLIGWIAAAASAWPQIIDYDTKLYHWNVVRWANEYAVVPGLANLHVRFGTNTVWLLLSAWIDHGPLDGRAAWIMPGFSRVLFLAYLLHVLIVSKTTNIRARMLAFLLLPYGLRKLVGLGPGLGFDDPSQFVLAAMFLELLRGCGQQNDLKGPRSLLSPTTSTLVGTLAALSFVIKPVGAPALLVVGLLLIWNLIQRMRFRDRGWISEGLSYSFPALILVGWMVRNAVLTGWLLFPASAGELPVDWAVPRTSASTDPIEQMQSVEGQQSIIQAWARLPGSGYKTAIDAPLGTWFPEWYRHNNRFVEVRWLFPLGLAWLVIMWGLGWKKKTLFWPQLLWPATIFSVLVFWFHAAPAMRFGGGLFWIWFALCIALTSPLPLVRSRWGWGMAGLAVVLLSSDAFIQLPRQIAQSPWAWRRSNSSGVQWVAVNRQDPPLMVNVPLSGDQCGDCRLPSTPYPSERLMAREPGNLARGFSRD